MKIFLIWPAGDPHMGTLISELEKGGLDVVYWVCQPGTVCRTLGTYDH